MDRFSNLPDELIRHIGSFLSAKEAAFTNILSKRLLNLITIESRLAFGDPDHESFKIFADGLLRVRDATDRVRRFSLRLRPAHLDPSQYNLVNDCLRNVLKRGVMELELDINANGDYSLPIEVFSCSSVVKMKLGSGFMIDFIPDDAWLQALKALLLGSIRFNGLPDDCVFQRLITVSPQLEALVIVGFNCELWNWSQTVSSEALKRLVIRRQDRVEQDGSSSAPISVNTPNLKIFEYYDLLRDEYPVVNLNSLGTAILDLPVSHAPESYNATNLIQGLKSVENMRLDHVETMQLFDAMETAVPVFGKLRRLFTSTKQDHCCYGLRLLVENSPFLKSLEIEELHYQLKEGKNWREVCVCLSGYSFLKVCPIESLRITAFYGREGEMVQMQLILQNLMCLELLELHVLEIISLEEQKEIMSELSMIPRGSPKCKVKVIFSGTSISENYSTIVTYSTVP